LNMKEIKLGLVMTIGAMAAAPNAQAQEVVDIPDVEPIALTQPTAKVMEPTAIVPVQPTVETLVAAPVTIPAAAPASSDRSMPVEVPVAPAIVETPAIELPQTMATQAIATQTTIAPKLSVSKTIEPSMMTVQPQYSAQDSAPQILAKKQTAAEPAIEPATSDSELQVLKQKQESLQQEVDLLRKRINQGVQKTEIKPHPDLPEGLQIYSEALFLTPRTNLSTDFASTTPGLNPLLGATLATQDYRGSTGWRVGARYRFEKSPWEVGASITRFGSDSTATIVPPVGGTLSATQFGPTAVPVTQAIGTGKFDYTMTDLEGGYHIPLSSKVDLKLFGGLRIANIGNSTSAQYFGGGFGAGGGTLGTISDFRGFGPRAGLEARMALGSGFSVYGRGAGALLFGDQESSATQGLGGTTVANYSAKSKQTVPMVDLAIGLDWSTKIGQSGKFMAGVGYEYQHLFNASRSIRPNGLGGFSENRGDLSMQGFFAKAGFSWSF
jgi:Legionella pneumophila major outer membrane protein precursor